MGLKKENAELLAALNEAEQDKAITEGELAKANERLERFEAEEMLRRNAEVLRQHEENKRARLEARRKAEEERQKTLANLRSGLVSVEGADVSFHHGSEPGVTIELKLNAEQEEALTAYVKREESPKLSLDWPTVIRRYYEPDPQIYMTGLDKAQRLGVPLLAWQSGVLDHLRPEGLIVGGRR